MEEKNEREKNEAKSARTARNYIGGCGSNKVLVLIKSDSQVFFSPIQFGGGGGRFYYAVRRARDSPPLRGRGGRTRTKRVNESVVCAARRVVAKGLTDVRWTSVGRSGRDGWPGLGAIG